MKKIYFRKIINFILFYIFISIMGIQVHAAELELESGTSNKSNPFKFKISYTWTSKGQPIESYDVSENGQIAIAFPNKTIGVFDKDMNFLYQLFFENDGASGVLWLDNNRLFIDLRSNTAVACDQNGGPEKVYKITGPGNYYYEVVQNRMRKQGNDSYYCTNGSGGDNSIVHYNHYTILKRISEEGEEEILYEVDTIFDGVFEAKLGIFAYLSFNFIVQLIIGINIYKNRARKK